MGADGQHHLPASLTPGKRPVTHFTGSWLVPRAGLDGCGKSRPPAGFDERTVQAVARRYTDYAISVHRVKLNMIEPETPVVRE